MEYTDEIVEKMRRQAYEEGYEAAPLGHSASEDGRGGL